MKLVAKLGLVALFLSLPMLSHAHELGMPHMVFDKAFAKRIHFLMKYDDLTTLTDGEGMPVAADRRHWDGIRGTYLTVWLYQGRVKAANVTTGDGDTIVIDSDNKN